MDPQLRDVSPRTRLPLTPMAVEQIPIRAEGWNHVIERQVEMRWPSPLRGWFPDDSEDFVNWVWKFFQYVFPLDDPRDFGSSLSWAPAEQATLDRYLSHAQDLASATVLTARSGYDVSMETLSSKPEINERASPRDATVGFLTMLRQCYSPQEPASFKHAFGLVASKVREDENRLNSLKRWKQAHGALRRFHIDHLILSRAATDGLVSPYLAKENGHNPSAIDSPELMLSAVFYGDAIHWGDRRTVIESWNREHAVVAVKRRFDALRAAVHLGHLYVGFAAVVGLSTGRLSRSDI